MKNANIVFFYSGKEEKNIGTNLGLKFDLTVFPLTRPLPRKALQRRGTIVLIYDTTRNGKGRKQLLEIREQYPQIPIFLIAKDPSKDYLRTALACRVARFFQLPVEQEEIITAIEKRVQLQQMVPAGRRLLDWVNDLFAQLQEQFRKNPVNTSGPDTSEVPPEVLAIASPRLTRFMSRDLDKSEPYDVSVQFFGKLHVQIRGKAVPQIRGKKNASVLAYLLFNHHRSVHRDILIDKFWADFSTASARNSLNVAICSIRKDLAKVLKDQEVILFENESYCINPQLEIITDVEKFTYMWKKGRAIEGAQGLGSALHAYNKAVALYQKEFLENLRFEEWCESERANLQETYLFILNRLSAYFFEQQDYYGCINISKKMLSTDQCLEEVYRKLMKCYYALGLTDMAFRQYFKCKKVLREELDLPPSRPTEELFESMQMGQVI